MSVAVGVAIANAMPAIGIPLELLQILIPTLLSGLAKFLRDKYPGISKYLPI